MKKAAKSTTTKLASKKAKPNKAENIKGKKVVKPAPKAAAKKVAKPAPKAIAKKLAKPAPKAAAKKVVEKVIVKKAVAAKSIKKAVQPLKKSISKKAEPKKAVKPLKKGVAPKAIAKKVVKPAKPLKEAKKASKVITLVKSITKKEPKTVDKALKASSIAEKLLKSPKSDGVEKVRKPKRKPKKQKDEEEPVIENDILIEQLINATKRLKKPSKVPKQLRTFTNPMASLAVAVPVDSKKTVLAKKEPKGKFELEYVIRTSSGILYEFLTSPSGLSEWFADDVNIRDGIFTFIWEGSEQKAKLLGFKEEKYVRLQWLDKPEGTFFEFRIERDELTGDISLMVVDFADEASDMKTSKLLWDSQINKLMHVIGSY